MMHPKLPPVPVSVGRVCIDFDGTLAEGVYPESRIGKPIGKGIAILIFYANQGREIVVYTARPESHKERIMAWLRMAGLQDKVYDVVCNKPVADLYVDDRAWNPWKSSIHATYPEVSDEELVVEEGRGVSPPGDGPAAVESGPSSTPRWNTLLDESKRSYDEAKAKRETDEDEPDESWIRRMLGAVNG